MGQGEREKEREKTNCYYKFGQNDRVNGISSGDLHRSRSKKNNGEITNYCTRSNNK